MKASRERQCDTDGNSHPQWLWRPENKTSPLRFLEGKKVEGIASLDVLYQVKISFKKESELERFFR